MEQATIGRVMTIGEAHRVSHTVMLCSFCLQSIAGSSAAQAPASLACRRPIAGQASHRRAGSIARKGMSPIIKFARAVAQEGRAHARVLAIVRRCGASIIKSARMVAKVHAGPWPRRGVGNAHPSAILAQV